MAISLTLCPGFNGGRAAAGNNYSLQWLLWNRPQYTLFPFPPPPRSPSKKKCMLLFSNAFGKLEFLLPSLSKIFIGNRMIWLDLFGINTTSDILKLFYVISWAVRRVKFETILKYRKWYLCQISLTNHDIICLFYYPQKVCNFHT